MGEQEGRPGALVHRSHPRGGRQLERLLLPLSRNRPGSFRRWDWYADRWAEVVVIPPLFPDRITPHTEGLCAVVWHLLVSHPDLQRATTKWEGSV